MVLVWPVVLCRSDGLLFHTQSNGVLVPNTPSAKQLEGKTDENGNVDQYRLIDENDPKTIDWKRKLGGMLARHLGGEEDKIYYLTQFPEGYQLFEHVKYNQNKVEDPTKRDKKDKHAAGVYDRQDAHLYGYPDPARKRFRSPAEFFPHLLWLGTDTAGDRNNCTCKFCSPNGDEGIEDPVKVVQPNEKDIEKDNKTSVNSASKFITKPPPVTAGITPAPRPTYQPPPNKPQYNLKSKEQEFDYNAEGPYIYRPGELIWFKNGSNWRLGVIGKRGLYTNGDLPRYLIQPLSNPHQHQPTQVKVQQDMRPWLAWSVPNTTVTSIQDLPFDQVPWDRVLRGELDAGHQTDYVVDGSSMHPNFLYVLQIYSKLTDTLVLAAKNIDASYSLFDRDESAVVQRDSVAYKGMFLGAEKIWVGEPVRLKLPGVNVAVYIISTMIEAPATNSIVFKGDIYKLVKMASSYSHKSQWPVPSKDLPKRMVVDLYYRNEIAARKGEFYDWQLIDTGAYKGLEDVKGRWYEMKALLPTLKGEQKYEADIKMGETNDAGEWMNSRRDKNPFPNQRKRNRKDALGRSVPDSFKPSRGLDGPATDNLFPDQQPAATANPAQVGYEDINQYMDLDGAQDYYSGDMQH